MSGDLTATGFDSFVDIVTGAAFALFGRADILDASSDALQVSVSLSNPADGALVDPNAAQDGGAYDSVTGTYTVSGTAAQVTAALQGLLFQPAPSVGNGIIDFMTVLVSDGAGQSLVTGTDAQIYLGTSYTSGGQNISFSGALTVIGPGGSQEIYSANVNSTGGTLAALDGADVALTDGVVWLVGGANQVEFDSGNPQFWNAAYGNGGVFTLDDSSLSIFGDDAEVVFVAGQAGDAVSLYGAVGGGYADTVAGSDGTIIEDNVAVTLNGDDDTVFFNGDDDQLDLTATTAGAWSALYAAGGVVNLEGASLSIFGGGVIVNSVSGQNAASLYRTDGVADSLNGDDLTVTLNQAQAVLNGGGGDVWFEGGSGSTVTINASGATATDVYGAGAILLNGGIVNSVGGGALVEFLQPGGVANLSFTNGVWDRVQGAAGTTTVQEAQVVVVGGAQSLDFVSGDDNAATLTQTNGDWDSVYGAARTLTVDAAQANIYGTANNLYLAGSGTQVSLYNQSGGYNASMLIWGSNATVINNGDNFFTLNGGDDTIFVPSSFYGYFTLAGTDGAWDTVFMDSGYLQLNAAQASVFGGGADISLQGPGSAVSLYQTNGDADTVSGPGAVTLNDAQALSPFGYLGTEYFYFGGAANSLDLRYYGNQTLSDDILNFTGAFGQDTIQGFSGDNKVQLSHTQFADFAAVQRALSQQGDDAVLTLDADDKVTFVGVATTSLSSSQFSFV